MDNLTDQLAALFKETGHAHHQAFIASDGADAEWPLWYADYLDKRLPDLLGTKLTKSEIVYLFVLMSKEHAARAPGTDWTTYYAMHIAEIYGHKA